MQLIIDPQELIPVIRQVVAELDARLNGDAKRLAHSEVEAAAMLGVRPHVLRDLRLKGEIQSVRVGRGVRYSRQHLLDFLANTERTK